MLGRRLPWLVALCIAVWIVIIGGEWTADGIPRGVPALTRVALHIPGPLAWMLSALGIGAALSRRLLGESGFSWAFALTIGSGALLAIDAAAGALGAFGLAPIELVGALLLCPGVLLLWREFPMAMRSLSWASPARGWEAFPSAIAPAAGVLMLACASAPGWLWTTEFGGYDALSYHLQLPREWLALGRVETLGHNVYSTFPSFMECAFMHVMALRGGAIAGALDAQVLHGLFALVAAAMVGAVARACVVVLHGESTAREHLDSWRACAGWCAAGIVLGLPWVIVTGSLAYDEMPLLAMLAGALWLFLRSPGETLTGRIAVASAILCAAAMGAKLTAGLLVVAPVAVLWCWREVTARSGSRRRLVDCVRLAGLGTAVMALLLAPWWLRSGLFPIIGSGPLSPEQAEVFHRAHGAIPTEQWASSLWQQFLAAGFGKAPSDDPWRPFWALLPWMGLLGGIALCLRKGARLIGVTLLAVLAVQVVLWLAFTHAKGRFLLPSAVPLALLSTLAIPVGMTAKASGRAVLAMLVLAWCCMPLAVFREDGPVALLSPASGIGLEPLFTGDVPSDGLPSAIAALPSDARLLTLGAAAPFWWKSIPAYSTVWNDNELAKIVRENPGNPQACLARLRRDGWTHVVIDEVMLDVWARAGWLDRRIVLAEIRALARSMKPLRAAGGSVLYAVGRD